MPPSTRCPQAAFEEGKKRRESRMADVKPFHLRVLERPSNLEQVRAELEERRRQVGLVASFSRRSRWSLPRPCPRTPNCTRPRVLRDRVPPANPNGAGGDV